MVERDREHLHGLARPKPAAMDRSETYAERISAETLLALPTPATCGGAESARETAASSKRVLARWICKPALLAGSALTLNFERFVGQAQGPRKLVPQQGGVDRERPTSRHVGQARSGAHGVSVGYGKKGPGFGTAGTISAWRRWVMAVETSGWAPSADGSAQLKDMARVPARTDFVRRIDVGVGAPPVHPRGTRFTPPSNTVAHAVSATAPSQVTPHRSDIAKRRGL